MLPVCRLSPGYEAALTGVHVSSFTELCRVSLAEDSVSGALSGTNVDPAFIPSEPPRIDAVPLACPCRT